MGLNFEFLWQRGPSRIGGHGAADTALFVAIWHKKSTLIKVKLNNGLLTNEYEETDTEFHQIIILRLVGY